MGVQTRGLCELLSCSTLFFAAFPSGGGLRGLSIFSPLEMISITIWETPLSWHAKSSLPVAVRVSKTRVLKLPNNGRSTYSPRKIRSTGRESPRGEAIPGVRGRRTAGGEDSGRSGVRKASKALETVSATISSIDGSALG